MRIVETLMHTQYKKLKAFGDDWLNKLCIKNLYVFYAKIIFGFMGVLQLYLNADITNILPD